MQPVEVPRVFSDRYELTHLVARGGMAEVYRARDRFLDRTVALKVLFPELSVDRAFVERFRREAQSAARLSHPNIVPVFDWGEDSGSYFIVMEYVDGRPLSAVLRETGPIEPSRAAEITSQVAAALASAHRHGVVHRDVKPGNVLITDDGEVKVTDFGIARAVNTEESLTQTGAVMGTATYFSPEQAEGIGVDARTDIYSLGVVLFEMLTGRPPFLGDTPVSVASKHVREVAPKPTEILETVPPGLEAVVMKAMAKSPDLRYGDAEEMRADLERFREGKAVVAESTNGALEPTGVVGAATAVVTSPVPLPRPRSGEPRRARRSRAWILILMALLAALGVVAYFLVATFAGRISVPDVVGQSLAQAEHTIVHDGLVVGRTTQRAASQDPGVVLATDPSAGSKVSSKTAVDLVVSLGPELVVVPNVENDELATAEAILTQKGLRPEVKFVGSSGPQNVVLSQTPNAGTKIKHGSTVTISIPSPTNQVAVPNLIGLSPSAASAQLAQFGLSVGNQSQACSNSVGAGSVSGSSPASETEVARGTVVNLVVSSGPCQVVVKNVVGLAASDANGVLTGQGLTVATATTSSCTPGQNGNVVSQDPGAGTQVNVPATVTITTCSAAQSTTTTTPPSPGGGPP
ncbi:MAG: Stk1 family PASTA domain-containing Ser/Thr kinase [Acidimicrobiales bacterium]